MSEALVRKTWKIIHEGSKEDLERLLSNAYARLEEALLCYEEGNKTGFIVNLRLSLTDADGKQRIFRVKPIYIREFYKRIERMKE